MLPIAGNNSQPNLISKLFGHTEALGVYWSLQVEVIYYVLVAVFHRDRMAAQSPNILVILHPHRCINHDPDFLRQFIPNLPVSPAISLFCISTRYLHYQSSLAQSRPTPLASRGHHGMYRCAGRHRWIYFTKSKVHGQVRLCKLNNDGVLVNLHLPDLSPNYSKRASSWNRVHRHDQLSVYLIHQPLLHYFQSNWFKLPVYLSIPTVLPSF